MPRSDRRPNILFIMSDDHASHAMTCYGSVVNETPQMDRIAEDGVRLDNCFCTNSICTPSRASILTGKYSHLNGVFTLREGMDQRQMTAPKLLQQAGYQTAIFGKWHLGHGGIHDPQGFDRWCVLPGQGLYHDPEMFDQGEKRTFQGYATDLITDMSLEWLEDRDPDRPFFLMTHHKAPHRPWEPDEKHMHMYEDIDIPEPPTFWDDYANRSTAAREAQMRVGRDFTERDLKQPRPEGLTDEEFKRWAYQRYMQDYLRCVASVDDNVGRMLDWLDAAGLTEDTVVIYTSDQGFFLGDHGWYDKRFMYEESLRMPFVVRYPGEIPAGSVNDDIILNTDFAPLFLDYAGLDAPEQMQGRSFRSNVAGQTPQDWRQSFYYRYFMHIDGGHNVWAHYGLRTHRYKLIFYYEEEPGPQEWELFDLQEDPMEMNSVYDDPDYADAAAELKEELARLRSEVGDQTNPWLE
ncbi:MAG: sulfatase [Armatimonadota bacterium]|nr:sulfatase [Armatimonadota bacterium]